MGSREKLAGIPESEKRKEEQGDSFAKKLAEGYPGEQEQNPAEEEKAGQGA